MAAKKKSGSRPTSGRSVAHGAATTKSKKPVKAAANRTGKLAKASTTVKRAAKAAPSKAKAFNAKPKPVKPAKPAKPAAASKSAPSAKSPAAPAAKLSPTHKPPATGSTSLTMAKPATIAPTTGSAHAHGSDATATNNNGDFHTLSIEELRKVKSGLNAKDLQHFRELLLEKRTEIVGDVKSMHEGARQNSGGNLSHMPVHMADIGSDNYDQEFTLGLVESEAKLLREIDEALLRIRDGYYGVCVVSGQPIARPRLEAKPWAKYSIEVAREMEKRGLR